METLLLAYNEQKLHAAKADLEELGPVQAVAVDLGDFNAVKAFIAKIQQLTRPIRYLVNAAGRFKPVSFLSHTHADYDSYLYPWRLRFRCYHAPLHAIF